MKVALDTNAYSTLQLGNMPNLKSIVDRADQIIIPFIVDAELKAGFHKGRNKSANYGKLQRFNNLDRVITLWADDFTDELYARIWSDLAKRGLPVPTNDIWIAAVCVQHQLTLATSDKHFNNIYLLQTIDF